MPATQNCHASVGDGLTPRRRTPFRTSAVQINAEMDKIWEGPFLLSQLYRRYRPGAMRREWRPGQTKTLSVTIGTDKHGSRYRSPHQHHPTFALLITANEVIE
jgi:hypothetical protein